MNDDQIHVLDAALNVFMRYGFRRATMGDIAQAAGLSRQSLYARFANKHEVYAAGLELYGARILEKLQTAWADNVDIAQAMDALADISVTPTFHMLRDNPDASDMIEAAESPEGQVAMAKVTAQKRATLEDLFRPYRDALARHSVTPEQLAEFVDSTKQTILHTATDRAHLDIQFATLKASVLALTKD